MQTVQERREPLDLLGRHGLRHQNLDLGRHGQIAGGAGEVRPRRGLGVPLLDGWHDGVAHTSRVSRCTSLRTLVRTATRHLFPQRMLSQRS
jgi:hypothetical protein